MARSLSVKHDEAPATSPLFTGFLLIAIGWLALSTLSPLALGVADAGEVGPLDAIYAE